MTPFGGAYGMVKDAINHRLYFRIEAMGDVCEVDKDEDAGFGCEIKEECNVWALRIDTGFWRKMDVDKFRMWLSRGEKV